MKTLIRGFRLFALANIICVVSISVNAQQTVTWTSLVNMNANGTGLIKNSGSGNGGAISTQTIPNGANGYIEWIEGNSHGYVGLSLTNPDANSSSIKYAFYLDGDRWFHVYEMGTRKYNGENLGPTITSSSVFRIERTGTSISYKINGATIYTSTVSSTGDLFVDVSATTTGHTIPPVTIYYVNPIPAPSGLTAQVLSQSQIKLSWTDNTTNETGFQIERSLSSTTGFALISTQPANTVMFTDNGLTQGTTYYYRIRAATASTTSDYSATVSGVPVGPPAPSALVAQALSQTQIKLTWTDNTTNETGFQIERSLSPTTGFTLISTQSANTTTFTDTGLSSGTLYYYRVRATTASANSDYSANASDSPFSNATWLKTSQAVFNNELNVGIGTSTPDTKLTVKGLIHSEGVKVDLTVPAPDYVFEQDYALRPLREVSMYINQHKHLPEVPSALEMEVNGVNVGEMSMLLLKKVEELTLYILEQENRILAQEKRIKELEKLVTK